ncbi:MAG TPA: DivIVA domain-containing protein [Solirubrobacteraceae bacterium]|nr:DivIVA domain-containing protein [Solirubrobacteraceae bacterium]
MTDSPRWERESEQDVRPPEQKQQQQTTELDIRLEDYEDLRWSDDGEDVYGPEREPRLATARESLSATRESVGESLAATRESLSATATKVGRWLHSLDRRPEFGTDAGRDPMAELTSGEPEPESRPGPGARPARSGARAAWAPTASPERDDREAPEEDEGETEVGFPIAALGYNRQAVDSHIAALEQEIAELRECVDPPLSITEEIERLGEQTASILVVAHDKAHETARRAQEQAARAVREAAEDAERITEAAQRRLRRLDEETDAVWRERERLLEDVREISRTLNTLADAAAERFPAAPEPAAAPEAGIAPEPVAATGPAPAPAE